VKLLWYNLFCKKCYINKGDLTWLGRGSMWWDLSDLVTWESWQTVGLVFESVCLHPDLSPRLSCLSSKTVCHITREEEQHHPRGDEYHLFSTGQVCPKLVYKFYIILRTPLRQPVLRQVLFTSHSLLCPMTTVPHRHSIPLLHGLCSRKRTMYGVH